MKIGFIGVGGIAGNYLGSLKKLGRPVAAVCDIDAGRVGKVAAETGAAAYADHREMLSREKLDVVFVAIPPGAHLSQVADAAESGAALFVAKPVALDLETARRAQAAISCSQVLNQVGYMARYSDITQKAREWIGDRPLGLGMGRFLCRMGNHPWWGQKVICGGQMLEQSTHVFDLLRYFLGDVEEVQAFGHQGLGSDIADFADSTVCNLRFANGAVATVSSTCCASVPDGFALELSGRDIYVKLLMDTRLVGQIDGAAAEFTGQEAGYFRQVEEFLAAVDANDPGRIRSTYADAVRTLAVTLAANQSLETGKVEKVED